MVVYNHIILYYKKKYIYIYINNKTDKLIIMQYTNNTKIKHRKKS